jgi:hypothetical protein
MACCARRAHVSTSGAGAAGSSNEESSTQSNKSKRRLISTATLTREGFIAAGDAAESFMDSFFGSLLENKPLDHDELTLLHGMLKLELERANFLDRLRAHKQRLTGDAPLELTDSSFELLADMLRRALREARLVADFQTPLEVLTIGAAFYRVREGPEFLWAVLQRLPVWRNTYFWEYAVFSQIERTKLSVIPAELHDEVREWDEMSTDARASAVKAEQEVVCNVLTEYTQHMLHMGVGGVRARALVSQMCSLAALTSAQRDMLLALADNIERVMEADKMTRATLRRDPGAGDRVALSGGDANGGDDGDDGALLGDVVDVLNDRNSTRRRLGGDRYSPAAGDTSDAKQLYARLIALQRKGRRTKGGDARAGAGAGSSVASTGLSGFGAPADSASARRNLPPQASMEQFKTHQVTTLKGHAAGVECIAVSSTRVASGAKDGSLQLWQLDSGVPDASLRGHTDRISALAFVDVDDLVSGSYDKTLRVWNTAVASGAPQARGPHRLDLRRRRAPGQATGAVGLVRSHAQAVGRAQGRRRRGDDVGALGPDHRLPVRPHSASWWCRRRATTTLKVWDMRKRNRCLFTLQGPPRLGQVLSVRWQAARVGLVRPHDQGVGHEDGPLHAHAHGPHGRREQRALRRRRRLAGVGLGRPHAASCGQLKTGDCLRTYEGHTGEVETFAIADGRMYSGANDGAICAWALDDTSSGGQAAIHAGGQPHRRRRRAAAAAEQRRGRRGAQRQRPQADLRPHCERLGRRHVQAVALPGLAECDAGRREQRCCDDGEPRRGGDQRWRRHVAGARSSEGGQVESAGQVVVVSVAEVIRLKIKVSLFNGFRVRRARTPTAPWLRWHQTAAC